MEKNSLNMKLVIVTQDDIFYLPLFFKHFFEQLNQKDYHVEMVAILSAFNENCFALAKRMYNFYGFHGFLREGFRYATRKILGNLYLYDNSIQSLAEKHGIKVEKINNVNNPSFIHLFKSKKPDVILSVAASQIFGKNLLSIPKWGCINVHCAKLPKYRGMMPNFWAMYRGESKTGITIHTIDEEIDKGKIIVQEEIDILPDETWDSLIKRSKVASACLVIEALAMIKDGSVRLKNYEGESFYFSFPSKKDIKRFRERGYRLL